MFSMFSMVVCLVELLGVVWGGGYIKENIAVEEEEPQIPFSSKVRSNCSPNYNQSKATTTGYITVDASFSNWLTLPNTDGAKSCSGAFDMPSSKENSFSRGSREDRVILDITNLETL